MRALVTGASGFLGHHLVPLLVQGGETVRCFVRSRSSLGDLARLPIEVALGDVVDRSSLVDAMEGVDVVFHLAGLRRSSSRSAFFRVNTEGTSNVCDAMLARSARRLVLCSSLAACGPSSPRRPRVEDDPPSPLEWYGESKLEAERIAFSHRGRFEVSAARPCRIVGPGDRENLFFFRLVRRGLRLELTGGPRPLSLVDVEDVADLLILLSRRPEAQGEAFFVASDETMTLEVLQDAVAALLRVRPRSIRISPLALRTMAGLADFASGICRRQLPLNRKLAEQLLAPAWTCSASKAERILGFKARISLPASIERSASWYRERGFL